MCVWRGCFWVGVPSCQPRPYFHDGGIQARLAVERLLAGAGLPVDGARVVGQRVDARPVDVDGVLERLADGAAVAGAREGDALQVGLADLLRRRRQQRLRIDDSPAETAARDTRPPASTAAATPTHSLPLVTCVAFLTCPSQCSRLGEAPFKDSNPSPATGQTTPRQADWKGRERSRRGFKRHASASDDDAVFTRLIRRDVREPAHELVHEVHLEMSSPGGSVDGTSNTSVAWFRRQAAHRRRAACGRAVGHEASAGGLDPLGPEPHVTAVP